MQPAQYAQYLAWLRSHTFSPFQRATYNRQKLASSAARRNAVQARRVAQLAAPPAASGGWIAGGNDWHRGCAAVAAANSLLATTGHRMPDSAILGLYLAASGGRDEGASIADVLSVLEDAGVAAGEQLEDGEPLDGDGLILDLDLTTAQQSQDAWDWAPDPAWGPHAAALAAGSVVTWGRAVPVTPAFLERQMVAAWRVRWP
jgi:hypothetical protein